MNNLEAFYFEVVNLRAEMQRIVAEFKELQARCPHPKDSIMNNDAQTTCGRCQKILWSKQKADEATLLLSDNDVVNAGNTYLQLVEKSNLVVNKMEQLQSRCPHPESLRESQPEAWPVCGICGKNWFVIEDEKYQAKNKKKK